MWISSSSGCSVILLARCSGPWGGLSPSQGAQGHCCMDSWGLCCSGGSLALCQPLLSPRLRALQLGWQCLSVAPEQLGSAPCSWKAAPSGEDETNWGISGLWGSSSKLSPVMDLDPCGSQELFLAPLKMLLVLFWINLGFSWRTLLPRSFCKPSLGTVQRPIAVRAVSGQWLSAMLASLRPLLCTANLRLPWQQNHLIAGGVKSDCSWSHGVDEPHVSISLELSFLTSFRPIPAKPSVVCDVIQLHLLGQFCDFSLVIPSVFPCL